MCSYFKFCIRHIQSYSSITQEHTHAYAEPCVFLAYSETRQIPITKHIQVPRYIHNTILNIFTIPPSWTFDTVLHASVFRTPPYLGMLYFRHILPQLYLPIFRYILADSGISRILAQLEAYSEPMAYSAKYSEP